jgi:hypothetical protein
MLVQQQQRQTTRPPAVRATVTLVADAWPHQGRRGSGLDPKQAVWTHPPRSVGDRRTREKRMGLQPAMLLVQSVLAALPLLLLLTVLGHRTAAQPSHLAAG